MPRPRLSAQASGLPGGASPPSQEQGTEGPGPLPGAPAWVRTWVPMQFGLMRVPNHSRPHLPPCPGQAGQREGWMAPAPVEAAGDLTMGGVGNVTLGSCPPSTRSAPGCASSKCPPQQGRLCLGDKRVFVALLPPAWHGSVSPPLLPYTGPARRQERLPMTFWVELLLFPFFLTFSKYLIHQKVTAQNSLGCEMSSHLHQAAGNRIEVRGTPVTCARQGRLHR